MKALKAEFLSSQFFRFLLVGGFAAAVNFLSRIFFSNFVSYTIAIILAFAVGMATAYALSRLYVFEESQRSHLHGMTYFLVVNLVSLAQTLVISLVLAYYLLPAIGVFAYREGIAHLAGVCAPVFTSYLAHKYWTFG